MVGDLSGWDVRVFDRGRQWVSKAEVVALSWDKSLVIPRDL